MSSIFSKLSGTERHKEFIDRLEINETAMDPGRKASSVAGMTEMGIGLKITCARHGVAAIGGDALIALAGPDTLLKSIRFTCRSCGENAIAMPENLDRLHDLPSADEYFSHTVKSVAPSPDRKPGTSQSDGHANTRSETPPLAVAADVPVRKKRGRPPKSSLTVATTTGESKAKTSLPSDRKPEAPVSAAPVRRRGRPPKQPQEATVQQEAATPRKRGRPRKTAPSPAAPASAEKPVRKRGRPPKATKPAKAKSSGKAKIQRGKSVGKKA